MSTTQQAMIHSSNDLGLRELYVAVMARKRTVVLCAAFGALAGLALALLLKPVYRVEVLAAPVTIASSSGAIGGLVTQLGGGLGSLASGILGGKGGSDKEASIAMLSSRAFAASFIEDKNLLPELYASRWDAERGAWRDDPPTLNEAVKKFGRSILKVSEDRRSGLVRVTVEWRDPAVAAAWANELVDRLNATARRQAIEDAQGSLKFLREEQAKNDMVVLQQAIGKLMEAQLQSIMMANVKEEYAFKVIDPAVAPDDDDYVRPRRVLLGGGALIFGALFGIFVALVAAALARPETH